MDFLNIGQQFVQHYYNIFDTARPVLSFFIDLYART